MASEVQPLSPKTFQHPDSVDRNLADKAVAQINDEIVRLQPNLTNGGSVRIEEAALEAYAAASPLTRKEIDRRFHNQGWTIRYEESTERRPGGTTLRTLTLVVPSPSVQR